MVSAGRRRAHRLPLQAVELTAVLAIVVAIFLGGADHASVLPVLVAVVAASAIAMPRPARSGAAIPVGTAAVDAARLRYGRTHISSYAGGADKKALRVPSGAVVAFRSCAGVAVTTGDPLGDGTVQARAIAEFAAVRRPCFFQVEPELSDAYRAAGMALRKFGEEAIVDLDDFTLATPSRANVRREVNRARRAGLSATVLPWSALTPELGTELRDVSRVWLRGRGSEMGFSLGRLDETVDPEAWLTVVRDGAGDVHAFSSWLRMGEDGLALDLVRRRPDAAAGAMDMCLAETLEEARRRGLHRASLGSVPFCDTLGDAADGRVARRVRAALYRSNAHGYRYSSLASFKQKFDPVWVSRHVAYPRGSALRVAFALVRVHSGNAGGSR